jgi:hypothetical protein
MHNLNFAFDILIFFSIYVLIFLSISGYGFLFSSIIKYEPKNSFDSYLMGMPILTLTSFFIYLTFGYNKYFNFFFLCLGILVFLKRKKKEIYNIFFISLFFLGIIIAKSHDDFFVYHFQYIKEIYESKRYIGIANLDFRYSYSSMLPYAQALFKFPFFEYKFIQVPVYLIFVSLLGYLYSTINVTKDKIFSYLKLITIFFFLIKFHRFSKFGYDYIGQFISILIFFKIFDNETNLFKNKLLILFFSVFLIMIKFNNLIIFPILLYLLKKENINSIFKKLSNNKILFFFILIMFFSFFLNNILKSGCLLFILKGSCFSKEVLSWVVPPGHFTITLNGVTWDWIKLGELWSKAFLEQQNLNHIEYLKNFNWVYYWFKKHFIYRFTDFLLLFFFIFFIISYYFKNNLIFKIKKNNFVLILLSFITMFIWFINIPEFRFGFGYLLIFIYSLLISFVNIKINEIKKLFLIKSFIFFIIIFNLNNLSRIHYSYFKETEGRKFTNFPWFNLPLVDPGNIIYLDNGEYYVQRKNFDDFCSNSPTPCSLFANVKIKKKFLYNVISIND